MQVKLRKCGVCGEWFNTTSQVMNEHYQRFHPFLFSNALAIAFRITTETCNKAQAECKRLSTNFGAIEGFVPGEIIVQGSFKQVSFATFNRNMLLSLWKNSFGYRRFFIMDWWTLKLRIKLDT